MHSRTNFLEGTFSLHHLFPRSNNGDKYDVLVHVPLPLGQITRALGYNVQGPLPVRGPTGGRCSTGAHINKYPLA